MEPSQAKPLKRRRRLILALLLVLVSGVAWWEWPRGDARFVGKWQLSTDPYGYWDLRSNGVAVWMLNRPPYGRAYTWWRAADDRLEIGRDEHLNAPNWLTWLMLQWNTRLRRRQLLYNGVVLRLLKIEPDRLSAVEAHYDVNQQTWFDTQRRILLTHPQE